LILKLYIDIIFLKELSKQKKREKFMPPNMQPQYNRVIELDRSLRKSIAEYYFALKGLNDPVKAVELLASHVAIMVEMIKDLKSSE